MAEHYNFWEIPFAPDELAEFYVVEEPSLLDHDHDDAATAEAIDVLREILGAGLTDRQRQIVYLYFFQRASQVEIAAALRISQQTVSRQLFGVMRNGKKVGGAVARLRKLCAERGIDGSEWV